MAGMSAAHRGTPDGVYAQSTCSRPRRPRRTRPIATLKRYWRRYKTPLNILVRSIFCLFQVRPQATNYLGTVLSYTIDRFNLCDSDLIVRRIAAGARLPCPMGNMPAVRDLVGNLGCTDHICNGDECMGAPAVPGSGARRHRWSLRLGDVHGIATSTPPGQADVQRSVQRVCAAVVSRTLMAADLGELFQILHSIDRCGHHPLRSQQHLPLHLHLDMPLLFASSVVARL